MLVSMQFMIECTQFKLYLCPFLRRSLTGPYLQCCLIALYRLLKVKGFSSNDNFW